MTKIIIAICFLFTLASCSIAPIGSTHSARSIGAGNSSFNVGYASSSFFTQYEYGVAQDLDLGLIFEFGDFTTTALHTKYSILNNQSGKSWALEASYGGDETTTFYNVGSIHSYQFGQFFEVFFNFRYNVVRLDDDEYDLGEEVGLIKLKHHRFHYYYMAYGFNFWMRQDLGLNIYSSYVLGSQIYDRSNIVGFSILMKL